MVAVMVSTFTKFIRRYERKLGFQTDIKWKTVMTVGVYHLIGCYWCYLYAFPAKWQSVGFAYVMFVASGVGITCGVHRLFTHRSYKAKLPLKIFLMMLFASAGQNSVYDWVRDHRQHHKYTDTDFDPHNVNRGFFFSHIGWLMMKKSNLVLEKGRQINMSDIENDPVLKFDRNYCTQLRIILCYILPTLTGIVIWGEEWKCAVAWQCFIRVLMVLHSELTVNSFAHIYGYRPYNTAIIPAQNRFVSTLTFGEGWHNYHHVFPCDYKTAEFNDPMNWSSFFINCWARMGLAYDLKQPSPELVEAVVRKQGDGELRKANRIKKSSKQLVNCDGYYK